MTGAQDEIRSLVAIVVSWNGGTETVAAARSLAEQQVPGIDYRVLVVDNASSDDTVAVLRAELPEVEVLELPENLGYGAAANRAMAHAGSDAAIIANQDAVYEPGFAAALVTALNTDRSTGAVTAQVRLRGRFVADARGEFQAHDGTRWRRDEAGVELLNSTGNQLSASGNGLDRGWLQPVGTKFPRAVFGFHGGACALRAEALRGLAIPGFDERYFMYYEDTDLSFRLRRAGWSIRYVPEAVSVHAHASSSGTSSPNFVAWNARNRLWNARLNGPWSMWGRAAARSIAAAAKAALTRADPRATPDAKTLAKARIQGVRAGLRRPEASARVLLDFTSLPPQLGGVGRYLEGLAAGLVAAGEQPHLIVRPQHVPHFRALVPQAMLHEAPGWIDRRGLRFVWEQVGLPRLVRRLGGRVLHSPHYTFPLGPHRFTRVVTVHDATFFTDPQAHTALKRRFFQWWIRRGARANVRLIAPSRATAEQIVAQAGEPRRPITLAYHGVDTEAFHEPSPAEVSAFRAAHDLGEEAWLAFLGTIEPRKRVGELIRAHRSLGDAAPLLLISGQRGWDEDAAAELDRAAREPNPRVRELGYLPFDELRTLLGGAEVFCYPSIAEGFGLPVLEAMASGVTVVTTDRTALPEVGGRAVVYAEPEAGELAQALDALLADADARAAFRKAGLARARTFTWERCARQHLEAYS